MPRTPYYYRLHIKADDGTTDLLMLSSHPDDSMRRSVVPSSALMWSR